MNNPWIKKKENDMATVKEPKLTKTGKVRKPARTLDERIAELKALDEQRKAKAAAKATSSVEEIKAKILVAESKLGNLYVELSEAQAAAGAEEEPDEDPIIVAEDASV